MGHASSAWLIALKALITYFFSSPQPLPLHTPPSRNFICVYVFNVSCTLTTPRSLVHACEVHMSIYSPPTCSTDINTPELRMDFVIIPFQILLHHLFPLKKKKIYIYIYIHLIAESASCFIGDLSLWPTGLVAPRHVGSQFLDQGLNSSPLHCKVDS